MVDNLHGILENEKIVNNDTRLGNKKSADMEKNVAALRVQSHQIVIAQNFQQLT